MKVALRRLTERERAEVGAERLARGPVMAAKQQVVDAAGDIGAPLVALSTLVVMERNGTITPKQRYAGELFHDQFRRAGLDALKAAPLVRLVGCGAAGWQDVPGCERARRAVGAAIKALGGSPIVVSCAWHVLGLEWSLRAWAAHGARGNVHLAAGVLVAATDGLVSHWRLDRACRTT
jgi:hypothetical protein